MLNKDESISPLRPGGTRGHPEVMNTTVDKCAVACNEYRVVYDKGYTRNMDEFSLVFQVLQCYVVIVYKVT